MTGVEHDLRAHEAVDDLRFGTLTAKIEDVKNDVGKLTGEMRSGFKAVNTSISQLEKKIGGGPPPGHWHIGPLGQWLMALVSMAIIGFVSWLGAQVYDLQPARIKAAQSPAEVVVQPSR